MTDHERLVALRRVLKDRLDDSDLRNLCFVLGIDYESLPGQTTDDRLRELLLYCQKRDRLDDLLEALRSEWPDIELKAAGNPAARSQPTRAEPPFLREKRAEFYTELYRLLKPLARYDLPEPLTGNVLKGVSAGMRDWYFDGGGLYLSAGAREPYFDLKAEIELVVQEEEAAGAPLTPGQFDRVLERASRLRAEMRQDLAGV